jgi:hypothetical protein
MKTPEPLDSALAEIINRGTTSRCVRDRNEYPKARSGTVSSSQNEIGGDNPCSRQLSGKTSVSGKASHRRSLENLVVGRLKWPELRHSLLQIMCLTSQRACNDLVLGIALVQYFLVRSRLIAEVPNLFGLPNWHRVCRTGVPCRDVAWV